MERCAQLESEKLQLKQAFRTVYKLLVKEWERDPDPVHTTRMKDMLELFLGGRERLEEILNDA